MIIVDIETAPLPDAGDYLEPARAPKNWKDPVKIAAHQEEKRAEQLANAGLDKDLCRIVALGWQIDGGPVEVDVVKGGDVDEKTLLLAFWSQVRDHSSEIGGAHFVGYNCVRFDIPVLLRRSLYLNVKAPRIEVSKYRHPQITDLMQLLCGDDEYRSLKFYARRIGLDHDDETNGSEIAALVSAGEWDKVAAHCESDVRLTAALAERMGVL